MRTMNGRWSGATRGAMVILLGAAAACSSGSEIDSGATGSTTTSASTSTSTSTGQGGDGGDGGATTTSSSSTDTGGGGAGGTGGAGAGGGTGGAGGGACVPKDEVCNGEDDDCDGNIDNGDPGGGAECSTGLKGICAVGHESCIQGVLSCKPDHGPGELPETCNGLDDDCNGFVDEGLTLQPYYKDGDGDGWGTDATLTACAPPPGYADKNGDCNDNNPNIYPGAAELCNDADDNCNGLVDEGVQKPTFYKDNDGDGYGGTSTKFSCTAPDGYVENSGDCNDYNDAIYPGAAEACNGVDDNCNGLVDDGLPLVDVYTDVDGDGHGGKNALAKQHCLINGTDAPLGYSLTKDDCDDSKSTVYPGAAELCDGVLNNCNLQVADYQCPTLCAGSWPVALGGGVGQVAVAQLDADAELEVVVSQLGHTLVLEHTGAVKWDQLGANYSYPSLADVDHDGVLDVVVTWAGNVHLLKGQDGTTLQVIPSANSGSYYGASIFDLDNDGWADVAPMGGPALDLLHLGPGGALLTKTTYNVLAGEPGFSYAPVIFADLDADARPELLVGSANWGCSGQPTCKGRFYAYHQDGSLYNDPTWTDPAKPWFEVAGYPSSFAGEGKWGGFADLDGDGVREVAQAFNTGNHVWSDDGATISGATFSPTMAPVEASGALTKGALKATSGPIVDLEGDGLYEQIAVAGGGMSVTKGGAPMDGYPIKISGGVATVTDLNRDGALDILWVGSNNAVNCWTMKGGTYKRDRVLSEGALSSAGPRGLYPTYTYDPFEPNEPPSTPDPALSTTPRADFRAFEPWGMREQYQSGSGWDHALRALIGHGGDEDYYWFENGHTVVRLVSSVPAQLRLDLDVFVYTPNGGDWQYACEAHLTNTTSGSLRFHPTQATGTCPLGMSSQKGFLVRVKGHDAGAHFGPWPYDLTWIRG